MTLYLFDAAYRPNLAAVKAAGGIAVNGYLTGGYQGTTTTPAQAHAAGLGYLPTYEEGPSELVNASRATGQAIGRRILAAFQRLSIPLDGTVAVYPSVDVSVPGASATACNEGWRGIRDILAGKVSVRAYAEGAVIDALAKAGLVDGKCWLAAPTSWPGFDVNDTHVGVVQLVGTPVSGTDSNHIITDPHALGAWWPANSPYANGDIVTPADIQAIAAAVWNQPITDTNGSKYKAATFLVSANRRAGDAVVAATRAANTAATVAQAAAVDATAVAGAIRDRLIALIKGGTA